jgi:hypothetical protein
MNSERNITKSPVYIEKNLDKIIRSNMRNESRYSPLNYHPKFLQDNYSRLILQGNKNTQVNNNLNEQNYYFDKIQHKYLNRSVDNRKVMWNLNNLNNLNTENNNKKENLEVEKNNYNNNYNNNNNNNINNYNPIITPNVNTGSNNYEPNPKLALYGKQLISPNYNQRKGENYHYYYKASNNSSQGQSKGNNVSNYHYNFQDLYNRDSYYK